MKHENLLISFFYFDGNTFTIVTSFIERPEVRLLTYNPRLGINVAQQAFKIGKDLIAKGIAPIDLQMRMDKQGGLFVIDPRKFRKIPDEISEADAQKQLSTEFNRALSILAENSSSVH